MIKLIRHYGKYINFIKSNKVLGKNELEYKCENNIHLIGKAV